MAESLPFYVLAHCVSMLLPHEIAQCETVSKLFRQSRTRSGTLAETASWAHLTRLRRGVQDQEGDEEGSGTQPPAPPQRALERRRCERWTLLWALLWAEAGAACEEAGAGRVAATPPA